MPSIVRQYVSQLTSAFNNSKPIVYGVAYGTGRPKTGQLGSVNQTGATAVLPQLAKRRPPFKIPSTVTRRSQFKTYSPRNMPRDASNV